MAHYSAFSNDEFGSSSKRRSRGPVMAAKKVAEGVFCVIILFLKLGAYSVDLPHDF